tara:strand:- start:5246 stop:6400 length:1155 start_codon:yes stop_codon:yes gene_type:complete
MKKIIIIGSGLSGLSCAHYLNKSKFDVKIFEKKAYPGGKVASENIDNFICDAGFQVLLNNYNEVKRLGIYSKLDLKHFDSGAEIYTKRRNFKVFNPLFHPLKFSKSNILSVFTIADIFKILLLFVTFKIKKEKVGELFKKYFSNNSRKLFLEPFFKGIFLSKNLNTDTRFFLKIFKKFALGKASLPLEGMSSLPKAIIDKGKLKINYDMHLKDIKGNNAIFKNGDKYKFDFIILACPVYNIKSLIDINTNIKYNENKTLYISSSKNVLKKSILLVPEENFKTNSIQCLTNISKKYSNNNKSLYSLSTLYAETDDKELMDEFLEITKLNSKDVRLIKSYTIKNSLPKTIKNIKPIKNIHFIGDWSKEASIDGAIKSGRLLAENLN